MVSLRSAEFHQQSLNSHILVFGRGSSEYNIRFASLIALKSEGLTTNIVSEQRVYQKHLGTITVPVSMI